MTQGGVQKMPRIKPETPSAPVQKSRRFRIRPRVWACLAILVGVGLAAHFLWLRTAPTLARDPQYVLAADRIQVTPQPPWIRTDIKSQVLRDSGLAGNVSVLDDWDTLAKRIKDAFELHPWIASVERITRKLPSSLDIELKYRRPVAAVESSDLSGVMLLPIDDHAVRLPEGDLTQVERQYLPRVSGITGRPRVGDAWDDPRVIGGAKLAAQLADVWQQLRLVEILASPQSSMRDDKSLYSFEIRTTGGTRIIWGATPGQESSLGDSPFIQKRQRLLDYAAQHGKLESIDGPEVLDVRSDVVVTPRTARHKPDALKTDATQTK
jgi:cell division septal protein FtsQ